MNIYVLHNDGTWDVHPCENWAQARRIVAEEAKRESAVYLICPAIQVEKIGDFVGVSHSFELKGTP